jgi:hypothetical protein
MTEMTCEAVRDQLLAGRVPTEPELLAHAKTCPACEALLADHSVLGRELAGPPAPGRDDPPAWDSVAALVEREVGLHAWLRSRPTPWRRALAVLGFVLVAALGLRHVRPDLALVSAFELFALLAAFAVTGVATLRQALPPSGATRTTTGRALLATALGLPMLLSFHRTATLAPADVSVVTFLEQAGACFAYGSLITAPLAVLIWAMDRDTGARSQPLLAAAVAGLAANAALTLHCANAGSAHLLLGHAGIGVALAAIAWLVHRRTDA